jgi:hypothetical protein
MSKFTFIREDNYGTKTTKEVETECWFELVPEFINFLKGCGYTVYDDSVGINVSNHSPDIDVTTFTNED